MRCDSCDDAGAHRIGYSAHIARSRVRVTDEDRCPAARTGIAWLTAVAAGRHIVTSDTILRWRRLLIARNWNYAWGQRRRSGILSEIRQLGDPDGR